MGIIRVINRAYPVSRETMTVRAITSEFPTVLHRQNIQECLYPSPTIRYQLPWEQKTAWGVLFGAMLLIAILGNCIVLWIVLGE